MFNLYDHLGSEINPEDIIKHENTLTGVIYYYLCGNKTLYRYDKNGLFEHDSYNNIKLDMSVALINDETSIWTRLGKEYEVYDEIFNSQ